MSRPGPERPPIVTAVRALTLALLAGACSLAPGPSATPSRLPQATLTPVLGLTWAMAPDVERPADAFAVSSNPATGPEHPDTAGHPGNFPGQAIIDDVAAGADRLVAVGFSGIAGDWRARAWASTDGLSWKLATIDDRTGSFAVRVTANPTGGFVAVGRAGREAVAWVSSDGSSWRRASVGSLVASGEARPAAESERMTAVVATSSGLLAGGSVGPEQGPGDARFWTSADGRAWQPMADVPATFRNAEVVDITAVGTGLVALGRLGGAARPTGSIAWISRTDRGEWERVDDPALAAGLAVSVADSGTGMLAVGSDLDEREAVAWSSVDGRAWTKAPTETSRLHSGEKIRMTDVVATADGSVAIGNYVGVQYGTGTSWLTTDGLHWMMAPDQPTFGQAEPEAVISWRDRLVIVGSRGAPDNYIPSVWLSPDLP
jgi:hypothetical protein